MGHALAAAGLLAVVLGGISLFTNAPDPAPARWAPSHPCRWASPPRTPRVTDAPTLTAARCTAEPRRMREEAAMALMASSDSARILGLHWGRTQWRPGYRVASPAIRAMGTLPVRCRSGSSK